MSSSNTIINGAPMTRFLGTQDLSNRQLAVEQELVPTHLAKIYIYAQKGRLTPQLVVGNSRNQMYGDETFVEDSVYATHQTVLSNRLNARANAQMIERIVPDDIGPMSNLLLSLDVLKTKVPTYLRDDNGDYLLDGNGVKQATGSTVDGFIGKWVMSFRDLADTAEQHLGTASVTSGNQTGPGYGADAGQQVQSRRYPMLEWNASSFGKIFNNSGLRLWAPNDSSSGGVNTAAMTAIKAYPFRIAAIRRATANSTPTIVATEFAEPYFDFCLKADVKNPLTNSKFSLGDIFLDKYRNVSDIKYPLKDGDFGELHVYQSNIDNLVNQFATAEIGNGELFDFTATTDALEIEAQQYLFNFFSGKNSNGVPYTTFAVNTVDADAVNLSENTNLYASGGSDGTMTDEDFAAKVAERISEYANPNSYLMDSAMYPESIFYDTGFPLTTKYALAKFIAERKDTGVVLSTYTVKSRLPGAPVVEMSASEEHAVAVALRTRVSQYPESDYFGTGVMRAVIMGRYGVLRDSDFTRKLPLTIELADKAAKMMGASDRKWKAEFIFDRATENQVTLFDAATVNVTFTPATVRNKDWDVGLNWVQSFTRKSLFFPALKTVYDNDTSILTSFFTMMACIEAQKVGENVWRMFSGNTTLTDAELMQEVNKEFEKQTTGRFAGMYKMVPAAYMTDADIKRGYSWTLPVKVYGNVSHSVMTLSLQAYRMSDLPSGQ